MDELHNAIKENDLARFIRALNTLLIVEPIKGEDIPATSDRAMIDAILANPHILPATRAIISGIGEFYSKREYLSERQRDTVLAMYRQWVKP